jgi:anti-sigma factor RsiW
MKCASAHELIESYLDGELDPSVQAEIEDHLTSCSSCADKHARLRQLQTDIRTQAPRYDPPPGLERRIRASLAQAAKKETNSGAWQWMAIAALILLTCSLVLNFALFRSHRDDRDMLAQNIVASHVRSLIGTHLLDVPSSDRHTVKPWFNGKLDFSPDVKDFASQGFPLVGGRIEYLEDRPVAVLVYQRRLHVINVFVWPTTSSANNPSELTNKGYNVIHWTKAGMTYWAVSDLSLSELRQFSDFYRANS